MSLVLVTPMQFLGAKLLLQVVPLIIPLLPQLKRQQQQQTVVQRPQKLKAVIQQPKEPKRIAKRPPKSAILANTLMYTAREHEAKLLIFYVPVHV